MKNRDFVGFFSLIRRFGGAKNLSKFMRVLDLSFFQRSFAAADGFPFVQRPGIEFDQSNGNRNDPLGAGDGR